MKNVKSTMQSSFGKINYLEYSRTYYFFWIGLGHYKSLKKKTYWKETTSLSAEKRVQSTLVIRVFGIREFGTTRKTEILPGPLYPRNSPHNASLKFWNPRSEGPSCFAIPIMLCASSFLETAWHQSVFFCSETKLWRSSALPIENAAQTQYQIPCL